MAVMKQILPFMPITKIRGIIDASTVLMMSTHTRVNEAHHHDPILEASQEHMGDQVMEKMASPWKHSSLPPKRSEHIVWERAVVVMAERVWFIWASNTKHLFMALSEKY